MKILWKILTVSIFAIALIIITSSAIFHWSPIDGHPTMAEIQNRFRNENPPQMREIPAIVRLSGSFLSSLIAGFLTLFLLPDRVAVITKKIKQKGILKILLAGILTITIFVTIAMASSLSLITFPLFFLLMLVLFLLVWQGYVALSLRVGAILQEKSNWFSNSPLLAFGVGHLLFFALLQVPLLNIITIFVLSSLGVGAVIATRLGSNQRWSLQALKEGSV